MLKSEFIFKLNFLSFETVNKLIYLGRKEEPRAFSMCIQK